MCAPLDVGPWLIRVTKDASTSCGRIAALSDAALMLTHRRCGPMVAPRFLPTTTEETRSSAIGERFSRHLPGQTGS
jgi:hypothetical protein